MREPRWIFIWLLAGADGTTDKRLVQVTSLRDRFTREFGQGFGLISAEKVFISPIVFS